MIRPPPRSTRNNTPFPDATLVRARGDCLIPGPVEALPCGSRSMIKVRQPVAASAVARLIAVVVLPPPPFCFATAMRIIAFLAVRSEGHTSELQSLMRNSYAVCCLKKQHRNLHIVKLFILTSLKHSHLI